MTVGESVFKVVFLPNFLQENNNTQQWFTSKSRTPGRHQMLLGKLQCGGQPSDSPPFVKTDGNALRGRGEVRGSRERELLASKDNKMITFCIF